MRLAAVASACAVCQAGLAAPVQYASFMHGGAYYHEVVAELDGDRVSAETRFAPRLVPIQDLFSGDVPVAAVTGTFFGRQSQSPVAEVVVDGELVSQGRIGSTLGVDWFGRVHIFHPGFGQEVDWFPFRFALRGLVKVVEESRVEPDPKSQHFRDGAIWRPAQRTAVGLTREGKVVIVATRNRVSLSQLGRAMVSQGVVDAVSLDGGGSTALYYRGEMVVPTGRRLCNLFALYERSPFDTAYQAHLSRIAHIQTEGVLKSIGQKRRP